MIDLILGQNLRFLWDSSSSVLGIWVYQAEGLTGDMNLGGYHMSQELKPLICFESR